MDVEKEIDDSEDSRKCKLLEWLLKQSGAEDIVVSYLKVFRVKSRRCHDGSETIHCKLGEWWSFTDDADFICNGKQISLDIWLEAKYREIGCDISKFAFPEISIKDDLSAEEQEALLEKLASSGSFANGWWFYEDGTGKEIMLVPPVSSIEELKILMDLAH